MILVSTLLVVDGLTHGQGPLENPVVPSATLGQLRHKTYPYESRGQFWTHVGVDLLAPAGTAVYAFAHGTVDKIITKDDRQYRWAGHAVMIRHAVGSETLYTIYLHLQGPLPVKPGDGVRGGQTQIGKIEELGEKAGHAFGAPHVHFEIRRFPEWVFSRWGNIYGPGDQRKSAHLNASWEDPEEWFKRYPRGLTATGEAVPNLEKLARDASGRKPIASLSSSAVVNVYDVPAAPDLHGKPTEVSGCWDPSRGDKPIRSLATVSPGERLDVIDILDLCRDYFGPPVLVRTQKGVSGYVLLDYTRNKNIPTSDRHQITPLTEEGIFKAISVESIKCEISLDCFLDYHIKPYEDFTRRFPGSKYVADAAAILSERYAGLANEYRRIALDQGLKSQYGEAVSNLSTDALLNEADRYSNLSRRFRQLSERKVH